jgi:hypothetical protein
MRQHWPQEIQRAQETPGARCTRSPCALVVAHGSHHRHPGTPGASCAMVLRLMPCSPRRRIRLVTVVGGLKACRNPVGLEKTSADLTPATGARTTRFCRPRPAFANRLRRSVHVRRSISEAGSSAVRLRAVDGSQVFRQPALPSHRAPDAAASTASHPASVTIMIRPSVGWDGEGYESDLGQPRSRIFFRKGLDRKSRRRLICPTGARAVPRGTAAARSAFSFVRNGDE